MPLVSGCEQKLFRLYFLYREKAVMEALSPVATILLLKKSQNSFLFLFLFVFFMLPFASSFKIFINVFTFLYVKANSKEIGEEILLPSFFQKMLMSAFLLRFKANYLAKSVANPIFFFFLISIAFAKIYFFRMVPIWRKNLRM